MSKKPTIHELGGKARWKDKTEEEKQAHSKLMNDAKKAKNKAKEDLSTDDLDLAS